MKKDNGLSDKFKKAAKYAVYGAGIATGAAIILPVITVSAPVLGIGAVIGAWIGYKNGK